jgi:hypothetical protein
LKMVYYSRNAYESTTKIMIIMMIKIIIINIHVYVYIVHTYINYSYLYKFRGSVSGDYEEYCRLGYDAM